MKYVVLAAAFATAALAAAPASATGVMKCNAGHRSGWKSMDALKAKLAGEGWQIRKIKVDGGCYEAYGTTPKGERVEAYFHPVSLETLFIGRRGQILFRKPGY